MDELVTMDTITLKSGRVHQPSFKNFTSPRVADAPYPEDGGVFSLVVW